MRVMGVRIQSRVGRGEETGATLVIVAIVLVALMGMLVLVLDVGGLLLKRRYMVQSADAAALAAAESCAVGANTVLGNGLPAGDPKTVALTFAQGQRGTPDTTVLPGALADAGGIVESATVGCQTQPAGHVSVSYTTQQSLFFAGVFGYGPSSTVGARSTAEWVPGGAANPVPFAIQVGSFQSGNCNVPTAPIGTICHFWEDNGGGGAGGFGGSSFGYVDTDPNAWNVVNPNDCPKNSNKRFIGEYAANGGYTGKFGPLLPLNYPGITWVCGTNGFDPNNFDALWNYHVANPNFLFAFPVVDGPPNIVTQGSFVAAWNVIGFVKMKLVDLCRAKSSTCSSGASQGGSAGACQYSVAPSTASLDLDSGVGAGQSGTCPNTSANVDSLTGLTLKGCGNGANSPCTLGTNYTYDTVNHIITFIGPARTGNVAINFSWEIYGVCGQPASNASGYCFVLQWEGIQLGNSPGGKNFGIDTVRLCDVAIVNSCKSLAAGG